MENNNANTGSDQQPVRSDALYECVLRTSATRPPTAAACLSCPKATSLPAHYPFSSIKSCPVYSSTVDQQQGLGDFQVLENGGVSPHCRSIPCPLSRHGRWFITRSPFNPEGGRSPIHTHGPYHCAKLQLQLHAASAEPDLAFSCVPPYLAPASWGSTQVDCIVHACNRRAVLGIGMIMGWEMGAEARCWPTVKYVESFIYLQEFER